LSWIHRSGFEKSGVTFPPLKEFWISSRNSRVQSEINTEHIMTKRLEVHHRHVLRVKCILLTWQTIYSIQPPFHERSYLASTHSIKKHRGQIASIRWRKSQIILVGWRIQSGAADACEPISWIKYIESISTCFYLKDTLHMICMYSIHNTHLPFKYVIVA